MQACRNTIALILRLCYFKFKLQLKFKDNKKFSYIIVKFYRFGIKITTEN